jgi:16S rRNA (cytosine967-C5)-methyltransferase
MPISPARAAAFDILLRVERESSYASDLLHSAPYDHLSTPDHGLTTELVMGALRWRSRLDDEIARASSQPLAKLDIEILLALRLALYQFRWLDRIPQWAALHESVELVKRGRKRSAAPFVNAVLRKLSTLSKPQETASNSPQDVAANLSHPFWLVERWSREYGLSVAQQICQQNQRIPTTAIRLRAPGADRDLAAGGITLCPGNLLSAARLVQSGEVTKTEPFHDGQIFIQDEASQLVAALVSSAMEPGKSRILDCCAAPGGKTLAIGDRNPSASITAVEVHPHRARLLQRLLSTKGSTPARHIQTLIADARHLPVAQPFDRVLADVPCSGTGTLGRNPEIKWRLKPEDLTELNERQLAILRSAAAQVAPGGRLVYSTCSLEKEENEKVVEQLLSENQSYRLIDCRSELDHLNACGELTGPEPVSLTRGPYLRTIPGIHPCDGFFAAILEKI